MLDRLLHRSVVLNINGDSYRMRSHRARAEATRRGRHRLMTPIPATPRPWHTHRLNPSPPTSPGTNWGISVIETGEFQRSSPVWFGVIRMSMIARSGSVERTWANSPGSSPACPITSNPERARRLAIPSRNGTASSARTTRQACGGSMGGTSRLSVNGRAAMRLVVHIDLNATSAIGSSCGTKTRPCGSRPPTRSSSRLADMCATDSITRVHYRG